MSSSFVWGCFLGLFIRVGAAKAARRSLTWKAWTIPGNMLMFGTASSFIDWLRRIHLEDACRSEERAELRLIRNFLDSVPAGEEEQYKDLYLEHAVNPQRI
eukprot:TRINITY_DN0_c879_g1_i1.p1 TRINITY_DN0_c879_g1~~TRINITY_DN0_c879_g1_i1.p1  ORF type:complete len:101 (-),score=16.57 TRINITY_DN0_c879_g1_i1:66-368(-)